MLAHGHGGMRTFLQAELATLLSSLSRFETKWNDWVGAKVTDAVYRRFWLPSLSFGAGVIRSDCHGKQPDDVIYQWRNTLACITTSARRHVGREKS